MGGGLGLSPDLGLELEKAIAPGDHTAISTCQG